MKQAITPTSEQYDAVDAYDTGDNLCIVAGAGAGKTSTLILLGERAKVRRRDAIYLAFGKPAALDAEKRMPPNVTVKTFNAFALGQLPDFGYKTVRSRLIQKMPPLSRWESAQVPRHMEKSVMDALAMPSGVSKKYLPHLILSEWTKRFCNSMDTEITMGTAPVGTMLECVGVHPGETPTVTQLDTARGYLMAMLPIVRRAWDKAADPHSMVPLTHADYTKIWALCSPQINFDDVYFDEAQDANSLMVGILLLQQAQIVSVGDPNQQIYTWRGAVNAMDAMPATIKTSLTQSFRFGESIAGFANYVLDEFCRSDLKIIGSGKTGAASETQKVYLHRTNIALINRLTNTQGRTSRVHVVGGVAESVSMLRGMQELYERGRSGHSWLRSFSSWDDFIDYSSGSGEDMGVLLRAANNGQDIVRLIDMMESTSKTAQDADTLLTTGHKSKGLEFDTVILDADFFSVRKSEEKPGDKDLGGGERGDTVDEWTEKYKEAIEGERANLLYVAATRAKRLLTIDSTFANRMDIPKSYR